MAWMVALCLSTAFAQPAVADRLIEQLDLARPELAAVREAYERGDVAAARKAFADHLRKRDFPRWKIDPDRPPQVVTVEELKRAEDALRHVIHSIGVPSYPYQFGERIDWTFNPTSLPTSPVARNPEWLWGANRHQTWVDLARAYSATGDLKYTRELCSQMTAWIEDNPPTEPTGRERVGMLWRGIEAGLRMTEAWPEVYYRLIRNPEAFPDDVLLDMMYSIYQHGENLDGRTAFMVHGNHLAIECFGLYTVGALFPEFKQAEKWRNTAIERELDEVKFEVYPDGTQIELAPGYHVFALDSFLGIVELAKLNNYPLPDEFKAALEPMFDALLWAMKPNRMHPEFNDSEDESVIPMLARGLTHFPNHPEWKWVVTDGREGKAPAKTSHYFNYAGWPVMRSGWDTDARYLIMEVGPYGMSHQHQDKLSFLLHAYGQQLVSEGGVFMYDRSQMRSYVLSARAHNVINIDGMEQNQPRQSREYYSKYPPTDAKWQSTDRYDYAEGSYGDGEFDRWGRNRISGFVHTRRVLFVKPDYWIVIDTVTPPDDQEHTYESIFHLVAENVEVDEQSKAVHTKNAGPNLSILPLAGKPLDVRVITGQKEPFYQGWITRWEEAKPCPTPYFTQRCTGEARFLYVFAPSRAGEAPPVKSVKPASVDGAKLAADLELAGGQSARVVLYEDGTVSLAQPNAEEIRIQR